MATIQDLVRQVRAELERELPVRLRNQLLEKPKEWLVEQLLSQALVSHTAAPALSADDIERERAARMERIAGMQLDETKLQEYIERYNALDRAKLEAEGYLLQPPAKGLDLISEAHRSDKGNKLLGEAKDLLFALLFGDSNSQVRLNRVERELLTITYSQAQGPGNRLHPAGGHGDWRRGHVEGSAERVQRLARGQHPAAGGVRRGGQRAGGPRHYLSPGWRSGRTGTPLAPCTRRRREARPYNSHSALARSRAPTPHIPGAPHI